MFVHDDIILSLKYSGALENVCSFALVVVINNFAVKIWVLLLKVLGHVLLSYLDIAAPKWLPHNRGFPLTLGVARSVLTGLWHGDLLHKFISRLSQQVHWSSVEN